MILLSHCWTHECSVLILPKSGELTHGWLGAVRLQLSMPFPWWPNLPAYILEHKQFITLILLDKTGMFEVASINYLCYAVLRLMQGEQAKTDLLSRVAKVGALIEEAFGTAQDVEGGIGEEENITVVQQCLQM